MTKKQTTPTRTTQDWLQTLSIEDATKALFYTPQSRLNMPVTSLSEALIEGFNWHDTPEQKENKFWSRLFDEIKEKELRDPLPEPITIEPVFPRTEDWK